MSQQAAIALAPEAEARSDQAAAMTEGLSICDMLQQYEVAKRFSFMEGLN